VSSREFGDLLQSVTDSFFITSDMYYYHSVDLATFAVKVASFALFLRKERFSMIISGGMVVTGEGAFRADIRIRGEKIDQIAYSLEPEEDEEVLDARGRYVLPGGIDNHTHFDMPAADGMKTADDFYTGTRAALAGGTTSIIDFAEPQIGESLLQGLNNWHRKADHRCFCDYGFHMTVTHWDAEMGEEIDAMLEKGITSFKAYLTYKDSIGVEDSELYYLMGKIHDAGGLLLVHCENGDLIDSRIRDLKETAPGQIMSHAIARPNLVEKEAVSRVIDIAALVGTPVYIVHVSAKESLDVISRARSKGQTVFAETCPHYLLFNDFKYELMGLCGAKYVMSPPLRKLKDQKALWKGLLGHKLDVISTDHCSFNMKGQKDRGLRDFTKIPHGVPGVENRIELMYHFGTEQGLTLPDLVKYTAENPARIFGLYPEKGVLAEGSDADIVVINPDHVHTISAATQYQNCDYTPYEGIRVNWKVEQVFLRGEWVVINGYVKDDTPTGKFLFRKLKETN